MKKRIFSIVICRSNPIDPDPRVEKTAKALVGIGHKVMVIGWNREAAIDTKAQITDSITCERIGIEANYGKGYGNIFNLITWQCKLFLKLFKYRRNYDVVHACDFDTVIPAIICAKIFSKKLVYDIFDYYADHIRIEEGFVKKGIRLVDGFVINLANAVILVDDNRINQIRKTKQKNICIIYNSPPDLFGSIKGKNDHNNDDRFRISFVGILQNDRSLFEMIDIVSRHKLWMLEIAGFGGEQDEIKNRSLGVDNVIWRGKVNYLEALEIGHRSDVMFAIYNPNIVNNRYASPNKIFEAMMLSRPIVVAKGTGVERIVEECGCGIAVEFGDKRQLEQTLEELADNYPLRSRMGNSGRNIYKNKYSWSNMENKLNQLYEHL